MDNLLIIFIAVTALAVLIQAGILVALFVTVKKSVAKMESIADEVRLKALPSLESVNTMVNELRPKLEMIADNLIKLQPQVQQIADNTVALKPKVEQIVENLVGATHTVRAEIQRVDATVNDVVDRARLQVIRADEMLTRTFDRVEHTSDVVTRTVVSPLRQVSGIVRGVTAGVEFLLGNRVRKNGDNHAPRTSAQRDEMFI